jgi:hypothetical protein
MPKSYNEYFSSLSPAQRDSRLSHMFAANDNNMSYQDYNRALNYQQGQYAQHICRSSSSSSSSSTSSSSSSSSSRGFESSRYVGKSLGYTINQWTSVGIF